MIDYNATLQDFFSEIINFLNKQLESAKDDICFSRIEEAINIVRKISSNPVKYADYNTRVKENLVADVNAFMLSERDNSVYLLYRDVLCSIENLNSQYDWKRGQAQEKLLQSLRKIKYKNSNNLLKKIEYLFKSSDKFAVQKQK